jgi:hypothetical protein
MGLLIWRETSKDRRKMDCQVFDMHTDERGWDWRAFGSTFSCSSCGTRDKTQIAQCRSVEQASLALANFHRGIAALLAVTASVLRSQQLGRGFLNSFLLRISAGAFVIMGILMGWEFCDTTGDAQISP